MRFISRRKSRGNRKGADRMLVLALLAVLTAQLMPVYMPTEVLAAETGTVSGNTIGKEPSVSGNASVKEEEPEGEKKTDTPGEKELPEEEERETVSSAVEAVVPLYNYDVTNVVVPARFAVALNPYQMPIRIDDTKVSAEQVVSRNYGIINKSSTDKLVTVTLTVEDLNEGRILFVDSAEEAQNAGEDTYALYLAAVPADDSGIRVGGESADQNTSAAELSDVDMTAAEDRPLVLREGENQFTFKLSRAVYCFEDGREPALDTEETAWSGDLKLAGLADDGGSATAFTFVGAMNPRADWGKLVNGIRISAVYCYRTASGEETVAEGTGALIKSK